MSTSLLNVGTSVPSLKLPEVKTDARMSVQCSGSKVKRTLSSHQRIPSMNLMSQRGALHVCKSALSIQCAEGQTQTIERQSTKITVAPIESKAKSPELDDGGAGFPPRDDDDGGGGGGGGGWGSGGFFLFGFFALLGLFKDQENDGSSGDRSGRR